jgi:pimeloyl-ACP methyl ester carboxylesterase
MRPASTLLYQVLKRKLGRGGQLSITLGKSDQSAPASSEVGAWLAQSRAEAFRNGTAWELKMLARPWGFPLGAIRVPVYLWRGSADPVTPLQMGRRLGQAIPGCQATYCLGEGHHMIVRHWGDILTALIITRADGA